ncbi:hypothetical protein NC651_032539 [Populus alba x Populus x berolinensis]|nr:hypothetical protein NC651_032539 [Populus alba x Populus x berolinensis]
MSYFQRLGDMNYMAEEAEMVDFGWRAAAGMGKTYREKYRLTRLEQYKNYENIPLSGEAVDKRLFFLNGKQDVSAFLLVDLGIIKYPAYSCIIFRTDFLSSK